MLETIIPRCTSIFGTLLAYKYILAPHFQYITLRKNIILITDARLQC